MYIYIYVCMYVHVCNFVLFIHFPDKIRHIQGSMAIVAIHLSVDI